jgi:hypothetical protein
MANKQIEFKVGASFRIPITYTPSSPLAPSTLEGVTITSQVRTPNGDKLADLTADIDDDFLGFVIDAPDGTALWPADTIVEWDIRFTDSTGYTFYGDTVDVKLLRGVTQD